MDTTRRHVAVTRQIDLSPFGDDLTESYAVVRLADFDEVSKASEQVTDGMSNLEASAFMLDVAKQHFVRGKIRILSEDGTTELVAMQPDDIASSASIINTLYLTVMGVALDPKATSTATAPSPTQAPSSESSQSESSLKTTSSTES